MRRIFILLTMAVAAITACTKASSDLEEERINPGSATYTYTITANNGMPEVKTNYDSDGSFKWSDGDAISVLFHNSDAEVKNKFFTLTLVSGANTNTATFSGEIENGYTIGASDGTEADKKIWALFPASDNHSYTEGSNPSFYVQPFVDFTATHFSANIPMYALNAAEGTFSFANLASTYKFTVNGIKDGVSKVKFSVYNQTTFGLSGLWSITDDGKLIVNYGYASPGSEKSTLTYISNVVNNQAVFYVSCHGTFGEFQPVITVTNYATDVPIKTFTASKKDKQNSVTNVKPISLNVSEANGGVYYTPAITIDGDLSDWNEISVLPSSGTSRIREWKFKSDEYNVYFYFKLRKNRSESTKALVIGFNTDNDATTGKTYDQNKIYGNETLVTVYPFTNTSNTEPISFNGLASSSSIEIFGGNTINGLVNVWGYDAGESLSSDSSSTYIELSIPREKLNLPATGTSITIGCAFDFYVTGTQSLILE